MDTLQAALRYLNSGVAVVPIWRDKRKNPHLSQITEYFHRLPTPYDWRRWANRWPSCNIGLITGYWGLVALDFDTEAAYLEWSQNGPGWWVRGQTWTTRTARGYHVWFNFQGDPGKSRTYINGPHEVLFRAKGAYCIAPPSIHHTGARYTTVHNVEPKPIDDIGFYLQGWQRKEQKSAANHPGPGPARAGSTRIQDLIPVPEGSKPNARGAYKVRCPFHDDQDPSAWLNIEQQRFGCNNCWPDQWWDVINVVAMLKGISNGEAFKQIKNASR